MTSSVTLRFPSLSVHRHHPHELEKAQVLRWQLRDVRQDEERVGGEPDETSQMGTSEMEEIFLSLSAADPFYVF